MQGLVVVCVEIRIIPSETTSTTPSPLSHTHGCTHEAADTSGEGLRRPQRSSSASSSSSRSGGKDMIFFPAPPPPFPLSYTSYSPDAFFFFFTLFGWAEEGSWGGGGRVILVVGRHRFWVLFIGEHNAPQSLRCSFVFRATLRTRCSWRNGEGGVETKKQDVLLSVPRW